MHVTYLPDSKAGNHGKQRTPSKFRIRVQRTRSRPQCHAI
jgi:hypothetical protein